MAQRAHSETATQPLVDAVDDLFTDAPQQEAPVRRSLTVGRADDPAERQADQMADAAMSALGTFDDHTSDVRRASADMDPLGGTEVDAEVQRRIDATRGGGSPLGEREAGAFSSAYGVDLSGVRVHADGEADRLSRSLQADAFTVGSDVYFRGGKFKPGTADGDHLIGHELAHVATESGGAARSVHRFMSPDDFYDITYEGLFTRRARAQTTIYAMLTEYQALAPQGFVPDENLAKAVAKIEGMIKIAEAYMSDHVDEKGNPDPNRAKRYAGFLRFYTQAMDAVEALEDRAGGDVDTTAVPADTRVADLTKHYMGDAVPLFDKAGAAMEALLPDDGQSASFKIEINIPIPPGRVGGEMSIEGERSDGKYELKAEIKITGGVGVGVADIAAGLGGYVKAKGASATQAAGLMGYAMYRRLAESNLVPWEVEAYIFGGSASDRGKRRAERKMNKVEADAFGEGSDDDNYAETGGSASLGVEVDAGAVSVGAELAGTMGKRTDKTSLGMAGMEAGSKKQKADSWANTLTGGARGAQESTGRETRGLSFSAGLKKPFEVGLEFGASWIAEMSEGGNKVMNMSGMELGLSCEEIPLSSLLGDAGAELAITAFDKISTYVGAAKEEICDDKEGAVLEAHVNEQIDEAKGKVQEAFEQAAGIESAEALGFSIGYDFMEKELSFHLTRTTTKTLDLGVVSVEAKQTEKVLSLGKSFKGTGTETGDAE